MSTLAATTSRRPQQRVTSLRAAKSEWIKLVSLRSSWITFAASVVAVIGLGVLISYFTNSHWSEMRPEERLRFDPVDRSLAGINLAQLAIGVLGVLVVTGEYSTGMIRSSLMSVPRRLPVLAGKAVVFAGSTFVLMLGSAFVAFLLGQQVLGTHGTTLDAPHALRAVIGVPLYLTVVALFAVGIGFIVRNTAGGIATLFGLLLVAPGLGQLLPTSWQPHVLPYLPSNAGAGVYSVRTDPGMLSTWSGFAVLCAWAVAALLVGAFLLRRRDA
ncbi:MAG: transporter permease [Blastococcus sp.]|jgi:ABC-type transport system involved in multi-copper enzyme maturation permease subunit|nr:transporter permease [Blastococcus sp.]